MGDTQDDSAFLQPLLLTEGLQKVLQPLEQEDSILHNEVSTEYFPE